MVNILKKYNINPADYEDEESGSEGPNILEKYNINPRDYEDEVIKENANELANSKKSPSTIGQDILQSVQNTPQAFMNALQELPGEVAGTFKHPERVAGNIPAGIAEGIEGALNIPHNIAQYGTAKGIPGASKLLEHLPHSERVGLITQALMGNNQPGDVLVRGLSGFAPYSRLGKAAAGLKGAGARAAQASAYATGQNQNPIEAGAASLLGEGAGTALGKATKGVSALKPTSLFTSPLSPEELQDALRVTKGTTTPLGSVIQNPRLQKFYENVLQNTPLSGATKNLEAIGKHLTEKGRGVFSEMETGANPENLGGAIKNALIQAHHETRTAKNAKYKAAEKIAEEHNVTIGRENTAKVANDILSEIDKSPELASTFDKKTKNTIRMLANPKSSNTYGLSNIFKGKLRGMADEAFKQGKNFEGGKLKDLSTALEGDIEHAISETKAPGLKEAHEKAQKYYGEQYAPFNEKKVKQFLNEGGDADTIIQAFLPKSRNTDRATLLEKLTKKLSPETAKLVPQAYFRPAMVEGTLNIPKLVGLWRDLGPRQRKALFPEAQTYKQFEDYIKLAEKNPEATTLMANPKTGVRNSHLLGALAAGFTGLTKTLGVPIVGGILATKALTHEGIRERFVKKLIENSKKSSVKESSKTKELAKKLANSKNVGKLAVVGNVKNNKEEE